MIINSVKQDVTVNGNFKTSSFKVQASAKAFEILSSNIYTHKVRAVIREISCNAHDAHVAAKNNKQFDVHLPTYLEPWFSVRDYGIGLSDEDLREIFTTYFCSTKTDSNEFIGALGLGSKSPFCLVDSFKVVSYHNGIKSEYCCYKDESGEPQICLLTSTETSEPNGLEVSMAVEGRQSEFHDEAVEVFKYFESIPNINDTSVVEKINEYKNSVILKDEEFGFTNKYGSTVAVMGNVAYAIPSELDTIDMDGYVRFELGELSFDPGREKLSLDENTKRILVAKLESIRPKLAQLVFDKINQESTKFKKAKMYEKYSSGQFGRIIRSSCIAKDFDQFELPECNGIIHYYRGYRRSISKNITNVMPFGNNVKYFSFKPRCDKRIRDYIKNTGNAVVLLTQEVIDKFEIDASEINDLDTLPKSTNYNNRTSNGVKYNKKEVYIWNRMQIRHGRDNFMRSFDTVDINSLTSDEKIYIVSENNNIKIGAIPGLANAQFHDCVAKCSKHVSIGDIYMVKSGFLTTKEFKNGNWISFEDYLAREFAKMETIYIQPDRGNIENKDVIYELYKKASNNIQDLSYMIEFKNFCEELDNCVAEHEMNYPEYFGAKTSVNNNIIHLYSTIMTKYPLLQYINSWSIRESRQDIVSYIEKMFA